MRIKSQQMVHGTEDVLRTDGIVSNKCSLPVGTANDLAARNPGSCQQIGVNAGPTFSASPAWRRTQLWRAAVLRQAHDQRIIEHSAPFQVEQQRTERHI